MCQMFDMVKTSHVYVHFPYCLYKCHYCDFNSYAWAENEIPQQGYVDTLLNELKWRLRNSERKFCFEPKTNIQSIFIGGGTPSLMRPQDLGRLLEQLAKNFSLASDIEITLETNPGTITKEKFLEFVSIGVNRFSIGIQSFNEKFLGEFGRIHSGQQARQALETAMTLGVRVNGDLIFGFPGQTVQEWESDLQMMFSFGTTHLSCYSLMAEEGTIYTKALKQGRYPEQDDDNMAQMMDLTYELMSTHGFNCYELSNFAKPGHESQHNLGYWRYQEFLGLGAGAVGQFNSDDLGVIRTQNSKTPGQYLADVSEGSFFSTEAVDVRSACSEFMMMGLRLKNGVSRQEFKSRFGEELDVVFEDAVEKAFRMGLVELDEEQIRPTLQGYKFNNRLTGLFLS